MINYSDLVIIPNSKPIISFQIVDRILLHGKMQVFRSDSLIYESLVLEKYNEIYLDTLFSETELLRVVVNKKGNKFEFPVLVYCMNPGEQYIICDIDFTISVTSLFHYLLSNVLPMKVVDSSVEILEYLSRSFKIIYLTGRHSKHTKHSQQWLSNNNFPKGPIIARTFESSFRLTTYKKDALQQVVSISKNGYGIGDLTSDINAYKSHGLVAVKIKHPVKRNDTTYQYLNAGKYYKVNSWHGIEKLFNDKFIKGVL